MSKYEQIEAFVRTIEAGSFTAAAAHMGVAKSAISRRIQDLEARLGAQLIIRTTRQLTLTEAGQALHQRAARLLADWDETEAAASDSTAALSGSIRIAAPLSFGTEHLGPALLGFMDAHPDVSLDIDFSDRKVDLVADGIDVAVRIGDLPDSGMIARKLAKIRLAAAASPDYISRFGAPERPEDMQIMNELRYGYRAQSRWSYTAPDGQTGHIHMNSTLRSTNGDFLCDAAITGKGVVIEPTFILYKALRSGQLIDLFPGYEWENFAAYAVYPPTRHLSARVRALVDHLISHCGGDTPYWDQE